MTVLLKTWEDVATADHIIVCGIGGIDQTLGNQILKISGLEALPSFPAKPGGVTPFFDVNGKQKFCLIHCYSGNAQHKNNLFLRNVLFKNDVPSVALLLDQSTEAYDEDLCIASMLASYKFSGFKTSPNLPDQSIGVFGNITTQVFDFCALTAKAMKLCMFIVDTPSNIKNPDYIVQMVLDQFVYDDMSIKVRDAKDLAEEGFGAILAVGKASDYGTYLIQLDYKGNPHSQTNDITLVGKGVTFDTGGISLKDPSNMHYMKSDLGGAAAILGAMQLIADTKLNVNVTALVPIVENAIDSKAMRPGDVITAYGGKSIEVIDTDAEGRLILVDALSYAVKKINPVFLMDMATLTGNCVAALGYSAAGLFTTNQGLADNWHSAGNDVGERCWPLPMYEEYGEMMESDIADIKNFHGRPIVGAITAAKFLEFFTDKHPNWAHLDIAGVAFGDSPLARSKVATGYGVRLIYRFIEKYIIEA